MTIIDAPAATSALSRRALEHLPRSGARFSGVSNRTDRPSVTSAKPGATGDREDDFWQPYLELPHEHALVVRCRVVF